MQGLGVQASRLSALAPAVPQPALRRLDRAFRLRWRILPSNGSCYLVRFTRPLKEGRIDCMISRRAAEMICATRSDVISITESRERATSRSFFLRQKQCTQGESPERRTDAAMLADGP